MKKLLAVLLILTLCVTLCILSLATELAKNGETASESPAVHMKATDKIQFAAEKDALAAQSGASRCSLSEDDRQEISLMILQAASATEDELVDLEQSLEEHGVYRFPMEESGSVAPSSDSASVIVNAPRIYYSPAEQTWTISTGGKWITDDWVKEMSYTETELGGPDGFGVSYSDTSGAYSTRPMYSTGMITNGKNGSDYKSKVTSNRSDGDAKVGVGFQMQDYVYTAYGEGHGYVGATWSGCCTYDGDFALYDGWATSYYVHTW